MKVIRQSLLAIALAGVATLSNTASAATLNITNGILMGASGVSVNGELYDVVFKDDLYANGITAFTTSASATAASQALLDQVFGSGDIYDTNPELTNGCTNTFTCQIFTVYSVSGLFADTKYAQNQNASFKNSTNGNTANANFNTNSAANWTLAFWTKQTTATAVPEPEVYAMMLAGLGLVGFAARRQLG